jgi:hypothetical protein
MASNSDFKDAVSSTESTVPPFEYEQPPKNAPAFMTIPATDEPRAQAFYEKVFGWNFWTGRGATVFFTGGQVMGRIFKQDKVAGEEGGAVGGKLLWTFVNQLT